MIFSKLHILATRKGKFQSWQEPSVLTFWYSFNCGLIVDPLGKRKKIIGGL